MESALTMERQDPKHRLKAKNKKRTSAYPKLAPTSCGSSIAVFENLITEDFLAHQASTLSEGNDGSISLGVHN
jgi:hypothetical protein